MHNKAPLWNEGSQVYQLDFGGRVTQESAKNFQIEYVGKQVSTGCPQKFHIYIVHNYLHILCKLDFICVSLNM